MKRLITYIPMRDGARLAADIFTGGDGKSEPVILMRTPYGRYAADLAEVFTERGYVFVAVDARGTGASEGAYTYYNMEDGEWDGYDLVGWLSESEFCNGTVGTFGGSALGIYQLLTAAKKPPALRAMCLDIAPVDFYLDQWYPGGVFRPAARLGWITDMAARTAPDAVWEPPEATFPADEAPGVAAIRQAVWQARYAAAEEAWQAKKNGSYEHWADAYLETNRRTGFWAGKSLEPILTATDLPVLHSGVLYDHFGLGTLRGYRAHRGPKRLVMQAGALAEESESGNFSLIEDQLRWFEFFLKGAGNEENVLSPEVICYDTGIGVHRSFIKMPDTAASNRYLTPEQHLDPAAPPTGRITLNHDPDSPVQSRRVAQARGDHRVFEDQVTTFTSEPVSEKTSVFGVPVLELRLAPNIKDANVLCRLSVVGRDGKSRQLNFGARKISLQKGYEQPRQLPVVEDCNVSVEFHPVCHTFMPGTRIRLSISLSDYPFFENSPFRGSLDIIAGAGSRLVLPVVE